MSYEKRIRSIDSTYKGKKVKHHFVVNRICEVAKDADRKEANLKHQMVSVMLLSLIIGFCGGLLYAI